MNRVLRRCFLLFLCLGFVFSLAELPISSTLVTSQKTSLVTTEVRGVWLTNIASGVFLAPWGIERAINQLAALNFNTIYPVVWNRGHTLYKSHVAKNIIGEDSQPFINLFHGNQDVLAKLVKLAKNKNLSVIPWFEYGLMTPPGSALAKLHPEWLTVGQQGINSVKENLPEEINDGVFNQQAWLNPLHPRVQEFIESLVLEVVKNYDIDGIQFDDHFGMPVQFGYDPLTIEVYQKEHLGKSPPSDPFEEKWMRWRADKITKFIIKINKAVKAIKPHAKISLSPNSQYFAYKYYLQDWESWINKNLVDELILQVYKDDKNSFISEIEKPSVKLALTKIPVIIGISTGTLTSPVDIKSIQEKVQIVRERNFLGFSFFYWESLWSYITPESPQKRRKAFSEMFPNKAVQPLNIKKL